MKFGLQIYPWRRWPDLRAIAEVALVAEQCGFDAVALPDHVVAPAGGAAQSLGSVCPDVHLVSAHIGALTSRIRLLLYAAVIPYRPVIQQAKAIATLDQLCGGRLVVVAGTGWCQEEFDALGLPFAERGPITDEYLRAMIALWTEDVPSFDGRYASFGPVRFAPTCRQQPHVPIWIAGSGKGPKRRLTEYGSGWAPMAGDLRSLAADIASARRELLAAGRHPDDIEFSFGFAFGEPDSALAQALAHVGGSPVSTASTSAQHTIEQVAEHQLAGLTELIVSFAWQDPADLCRRVEWFADNIIREMTNESPPTHVSAGMCSTTSDGYTHTANPGRQRRSP
jgi:probable F420-dependent oxidoreductase